MGQPSKIVTGEGKKNQQGKISLSVCDRFTGHCKTERLCAETIISLLDYFCLTFL